MDARLLTYFLAIVDQGGYGRAAAHLHLAQPSLSQAMAGLERDLGVELFRRSGRGVTLTDAGRRLVGPARTVLRDLAAARSAVDDVQELRAARIDLVTMPSPGVEPLTSITATLLREHPGLSLDVRAAFTAADVVRAVRSGSAELGLLGSAGPARTADLRVLPLAAQPLVLLSPPDTDHDADTVRRDDLAGLRMVVSQRGSLMRQLVDDVRSGGHGVHVVAEVAHRTSVLPLVLAGVGHAVVPAAWEQLADRAGLVVRRLEPPTLLTVALVGRDGLTPAAEAMWQVAARLADAETAGDRATEQERR